MYYLELTFHIVDVDKGNILDLIRHNVRKNEDITNYAVEVKELDFKSAVINSGVLSLLPKVHVILAADGKSIKPLTIN